MMMQETGDRIYESARSVRAQIILDMLTYWQSKVRDGRLPRPSDIDPVEIPKLLASVVICDLEDAPFRVRFRLVGTLQVLVAGAELTGRYVDQMNWKEAPFVHRIFKHARDTAAPVFGYYHWTFRDGTPGASEFGLFPMSADGGVVTRVLGIDEFYPYPGTPTHAIDDRLR
ncbi:MAG TPA: PAS domain-containing protein [Alphaproteobacteria bacterium]|nr:PAS domain-containing protein [Alphaproteobacteria bacterium]